MEQYKRLKQKDMDNAEIMQRLKAIAEKQPKELTAEERAFVEEQAAFLGLGIANRQCKNCYRDAAIVVYNTLKERAEEAEKAATPTTLEEKPREYELKKGVDVVFQGIRVCEATLTDELAVSLLESGFAPYYFADEEKAAAVAGGQYEYFR